MILTQNTMKIQSYHWTKSQSMEHHPLWTLSTMAACPDQTSVPIFLLLPSALLKGMLHLITPAFPPKVCLIPVLSVNV